MDNAAFAPGADKAIMAQPGKLLGDGSLRQCQQLLEFRDRFFVFRQQPEDQQTGFMGQCLEDVARLAGLAGEKRNVLAIEILTWRAGGHLLSSFASMSSTSAQKNWSPG